MSEHDFTYPYRDAAFPGSRFDHSDGADRPMRYRVQIDVDALDPEDAFRIALVEMKRSSVDLPTDFDILVVPLEEEEQDG